MGYRFLNYICFQLTFAFLMATYCEKQNKKKKSIKIAFLCVDVDFVYNDNNNNVIKFNTLCLRNSLIYEK